MRKLLISTLLTLCASSLPPATVRATVKSLNVPQHYQEKSWWCWDATINMVMRYYSKHWAEQCEVAEVARTHESTGYFGTTPCCLNPNVGADPLRDPMCNRGNWGGPTNGEMRHLLAIYGFPTTSWTGTKLPLDQAKTELNANRPFIIGYPGHVVVGRGFDDSGTSSTADDKIYLNDPWFDNGQQWRLYTDMADWTDTLKISAPASSDEKAILYQNTSYGGTSMTVTSSVSDLGAFSNQASSAAVRGAPYIFYDLTSYGAPGWPVVPDDYSTYTKWGETTDNQVSSVAKMPSANLHTAAVLYSGQNFTGTQTIITGDTTSIAVTAQSVIINNKISAPIEVRAGWCFV